MYNDEHNLYHYTYRKDGSEAEAHSAPQPGPVQDHNSGPQQPVQEMKPVKKNRIGLKVTALALCCAPAGRRRGRRHCLGRRQKRRRDLGQRQRPHRQSGRTENRGRQDGDERRGGLRRQCQQRGVYQCHRDQQQQLLRSAGTNGILRLRLYSHHGWLYCHQLPCGGGCPDREGHPVQRR